MAEWTPHGSDADYWRSDNPFIVAWYRFGDDDLGAVQIKTGDPIGNRDYASGLLVDSGPRGLHLKYKGTSDSFLRPTSGIAPWSSSGVIFGEQPSTTWVGGSHGDGIYQDLETYSEARTTSLANKGVGAIPFGRETLPSGFTMMGWVKVPSAGSSTVFRTIFSSTRTGDISNGTIFLIYRPSDNQIRAGIKFHNDASIPILISTGDFSNDEPFFVALQIHREYVEGGWKNSFQGSGVLRLHVGTVDTPLAEVATIEFTRGETRVETPSELNPMTFAQDCDIFIGGSSDRHLPPDSVLDEWVVMNDGFMSKQRMEHYMNSGIIHVPASDPSHPDFVPETPGREDLVAYWSFDEQTGANSNPSTLDNNLDLIMTDLADDVSPVVGVRGGSGIRVGGALASDNVLGDITNRRNAFPHVPQESGINFLFPDITQSDQWTWIGWMRARQDGSNHYGGVVGWFTDAGSDTNTAVGIGDWNNQLANTPSDDRGRGIEISASGISSSFNTGPETGASDDGGNLIGTLPNEWQLWAYVFDFRHGIIYSVRDAKHVRIETNRLSSVSGISKEFIDDAGAFVLGSIANSNNNQLAEFDDWAVYKRCLSIPEMSGFALSGVDTFVPESPLNVSFKQTMGYWLLDGSGLYDPTGVSGLRFDDESWYRHHLTNISGVFSTDTTLNTFVADNSVALGSSGAMISLERVLTGSNLDFSAEQTLSSSGFSAGMWAYVPSGDLATQGNGTSGLFGTRIFMGNWSQAAGNRSWYLGLEDNLFESHVVLADLSDNTISSAQHVPFNTPFFIGMDVQPSGSVLNARMWYSLDAAGIDGATTDIVQIAETTFGASTDNLNPAGASGFSLFNAPHLNYGFPQTTRGMGPFIYNGALPEDTWGKVKQAGISEADLDPIDISTTDPANISHWKFDTVGSRFIDFGLEQNFLFPINQDGNLGGVIGAIHNSGVVIRQTEFFDTQANNPNARRLDLGSGLQSWTFLTWVFPPEVSFTDRHYVMAKGDDPSGIQVFTPPDSLQLSSNASGAITQSQNGDLAPSQWNHMAIVFDRDNNEFTSIINGRYAGPSFGALPEVPINNSGMVLGGRGSDVTNSIFGGSAFSGYLDDTAIFSRALTLPEISGFAANSYDYDDGSTQLGPIGIGGYITGIPLFAISGLIGSFMHGQAQDVELIGGYVSGVQGLCVPFGGFMHGKVQASGDIGAFIHGAGLASGVFGHFVHGLGIASGFIGSYEFGACQGNSEFDLVLNFSVFTTEDFDARLGVEKTQFIDFDARLGVIRITQVPECTIEAPLIGTVGSGVPFDLTVRGSGAAFEGKKIEMARFTFADFKGAEVGTLIDGTPQSGLFEASRQFDTPGWYTIKLEVLDSFGYRTSCCRPFILLPSGSTSGAFINSLPGISIEATPTSGIAINTVSFTHSLSGLDTTSGLLEYTDFADQQESLLNSLEMPLGTQFVDAVRRHDYTMPGKYCAVWAVSGEFGIVSDTIADGIDYIV